MTPMTCLRLVAVLTLAALGGSSASGSADDPPAPPAGPHLAGSLVELFEQARAGETNSFVVEVLDRAIETGSIRQADYDEAHRRYLQCLTDSGLAVTSSTLSNGLHQLVPPDLSDPATSRTFRRLLLECSTEIAPIEALYRVQVGNPGLLRDNRQVAVDCLKREGLVDASYTVATFTDDLESGFENATYDPMSSAAQACFSGAGIAIAIAGPTTGSRRTAAP